MKTGQRTEFTTLDDAELDKLGGSCREHTLPRSWEHEDRSSLGGGSQLPSRPLRNRDHDQLFVWRWNSFLGDDREWNKQIRDGNDGANR